MARIAITPNWVGILDFKTPRLSFLCRWGFPGQPDDLDFFGCRLVTVR